MSDLWEFLLQAFCTAMFLICLLLILEPVRQLLYAPGDKARTEEATKAFGALMHRTEETLEDTMDAVLVAVDDLVPNLRASSLEQVAINREAGQST